MFKSHLVEIMGSDKYGKNRSIISKMEQQEILKPIFRAMDGDVDERPDELRDVEMPKGINIHCGLRGSKLSGG